MLQLVPLYPAAQTHLLLTQVPPLRQSGLQVAAIKKISSIFVVQLQAKKQSRKVVNTYGIFVQNSVYFTRLATYRMVDKNVCFIHYTVYYNKT